MNAKTMSPKRIPCGDGVNSKSMDIMMTLTKGVEGDLVLNFTQEQAHNQCIRL